MNLSLMRENRNLSFGSDFQQPAMSPQMNGGQFDGGLNKTPSIINFTTCNRSENLEPFIRRTSHETLSINHFLTFEPRLSLE